MLGFPTEILSSFLSKDSFQQEMESFLASDRYFWLGSFGSPTLSIFLFSFFFLTENRHLLPHWKVNPFFRQSHSPFLILVETIPMRFFFILPRCSFLLFPGLLPGRAAVPLSCLSLLAVPWPFIVTDSTKSCPKTWLGGTCRWETSEPFRACFPRPAPRHQVVLRMNSPLADIFLCEILFAIALFSSLTPRTSPAIEDGAGQMSALLQPRWSVPTRAHRTSRHKGLW